MKNKICCECRYMLHKDTFEVCTHSMTNTSMFNEACVYFEPKIITIGDKVRQMSDEDLAEKLVYCVANSWGKLYWMSTVIGEKKFPSHNKAIAATVAKLKEVYNETTSN